MRRRRLGSQARCKRVALAWCVRFAPGAQTIPWVGSPSLLMIRGECVQTYRKVPEVAYLSTSGRESLEWGFSSIMVMYGKTSDQTCQNPDGGSNPPFSHSRRICRSGAVPGSYPGIERVRLPYPLPRPHGEVWPFPLPCHGRNRSVQIRLGSPNKLTLDCKICTMLI